MKENKEESKRLYYLWSIIKTIKNISLIVTEGLHDT